MVISRYTKPIGNLAADQIYVRAPKLSDVLLGVSSKPWTREAFREFLRERHCSENLDFITEFYQYRQEYRDRSPQDAGRIASYWRKIVDTFILANAPREINIHGALRDHIVEAAKYDSPPNPELLQPAYTLILELVNDIYIQWASTVHPEAPVMIGKPFKYALTHKAIDFELT